MAKIGHLELYTMRNTKETDEPTLHCSCNKNSPREHTNTVKDNEQYSRDVYDGRYSFSVSRQ